MLHESSAIGSSGSIFIVQDGTGSRTASFHGDYKFAGGTAPTLSTAANAVDRLDYVVRARQCTLRSFLRCKINGYI